MCDAGWTIYSNQNDVTVRKVGLEGRLGKGAAIDYREIRPLKVPPPCPGTMVPFSFGRDVRCNASRRTAGIREIVSLVEADLFAGLEKSENERKLFLGGVRERNFKRRYRNISAISNHRIGWSDDRYDEKLLNFYNFL